MNDTFCTVGPKHIAFWDSAGTMKKGSFGGPSKMVNLLCVAYDEMGTAYTGAQTGAILKWVNGGLKSSHPIHRGVVHCIRYLNETNEI